LITVENCLACNSGDLKETSAMVSPFLARRVWDRRPFPVKISRCKRCNFAFFNQRMDEDEERRLYTGYRLSEYRQMRFSCEPWYTETFNANLNTPEVWSMRKGKLADVFREQFRDYKISSILDFGGDRGELIRDLIPGATRYVYEISDVETLPGILPLRSLEACRQHRFDLILSSNVLEHVGFPRQTLGQMQAIATPGTLVFLDIPYESPFSLFTVAKRLTQNGTLLALRPDIGMSLLHSGALVQMHEHVNYFCPQALNQLVDSMGWKILASGVYTLGIYKLGPIKVPSGKMTWCVAQIGDTKQL
jgi:hypothetical protein